MRHSHPGRQAFIRLIQQSEGQIDLIRAALAVASEDRDDVNVEHSLEILDRIVKRIGQYVEPHLPLADRARQVVEYLHHIEGFAGNASTYNDPASSYLHFVLERHIGLPITLSLILLHVGQQLDLPFEPSGLPGHFMVRCTDLGEVLFLDLYNGHVLTSVQCRSFLETQLGYEVPNPERFPPPSHHQILARLLRNLKRIYFQQENFQLALAATERILLVDPNSTEDVRDRGLLRARLGDLHRGLWDLEQYAQLEPMATDIGTLQKYAQALADTFSRRC
jgi:regulator of sirC expression with transglutaminase-like and TPR domain